MKYIRHQLIPCITLLVFACLTSACSELPYNNLSNEELATMLDKQVPVFDIRRLDEWKQTGIIEGSELLTFVDGNGRVQADFMQRFTTAVGQNDPVILICRTGNRTSQLARFLTEKMGYTQVFNVRNGITEWIRDKRPIKHL